MMKKERNSIKKGIIISVIICALVFVGILGSYAFFISSGTNNPENISTNTGTLALIFADGNPGINETLEFGSSVEKTFTIENTGTLEANFVFNWENLINTYTQGSLTYTLKYSEEENGTYQDILTNQEVPKTEESITTPLAENLTISTGEKYYYKLIITLNYLETTDQTEDLNAILVTNFNIAESKPIKISFNDGTQIVNEKTVFKNRKYGTLPTPLKEGYVFKGWYTEPNGQGKEITEETEVEINEEQTLYAKWETINENSLNNSIANLNITAKPGNPNFANLATTDEGIYKREDDYGTSYYYRGAVKNNYVKFAGFYWRIIRVNGDGSLRIIYDGTKAWANGAETSNRIIGNAKWNYSYGDDNKYIGYMYGGVNGRESTSKAQAQTNETNSNMKVTVETWYKTNIKNKGYDEYVADSIFCNDRSTKGTVTTSYPRDTGLGYGGEETEYGASSRLLYFRVWNNPTSKSNPNPSFKCLQKNDAFTVNDTEKGNGALDEKVGLITADELVTAGAKWVEINTDYYLYKGVSFWTMSPFLLWWDSYPHPDLFVSNTDCVLNNYDVQESFGVAPVINLTPESVQTMIGDGTATNPYRLKDETL